jgi:hypothetical protein
LAANKQKVSLGESEALNRPHESTCRSFDPNINEHRYRSKARGNTTTLEAVKYTRESGQRARSFPLQSQELNLLDQDRFIGLFLTHSDPVSTALSI